MQIWGVKTEALFDVWSFEHLISGMALIVIVRYALERLLPEIYRSETVSEKTKKISLFLHFMVIVYLWEAVEFYLEAGYTGNDAITHWFQGVEFWANRLITDPLTTLLGGIIGYHFTRWTLWARLLSLTWLAVHIFVFPHSMYLHEWMDGTTP